MILSIKKGFPNELSMDKKVAQRYASLSHFSVLCRVWLEVKSDFSRKRSRRDVMRAAERGKEVVQCDFVREVDRRELQAPFETITAKQVVLSHAQIEQIAWLYPHGIVVIILRSRRWYFDERGTELRRCASRQRRSESGTLAPAE